MVEEEEGVEEEEEEEEEEEVVEEEGVSKLVPVWDMCRGCPAPGRNLIQF